MSNFNILKQVDNPKDLKNLSISDLDELAGDISTLIKNTIEEN